MDTFISSPRLLFREWREEDKEELFLAASDNEIGPMAGWQPHKSVEDSFMSSEMFSLKRIHSLSLRKKAGRLWEVQAYLHHKRRR